MRFSILAIGFVCVGLCGPANAQFSFQARIVDAHNLLRQAVRVPPLEWDGELAAEASAWAGHLARVVQLQHSAGATRFGGEGENLWMGTAGAFSVEEMVQAWGAEQRDFVAGFVPDVSRTGEFAAVAHYTQMVWRETRRVGCGLSRAPGWDVLVCRYALQGNVYGQLVY